MTFKHTIAFLFAFLLTTALQGQSINDELSKLFFNVDVTNLNNSLLDNFSRDTSLLKPAGSSDTIFNSTRNRAKYLVQHTFAFQKNNYIKSHFTNGNLGVITGQSYNNKDFSVLFLSFEFKNSVDLDSGYIQTIRSFKNLGELEIESEHRETAVITNAEDHKRLEIIKVLFPQARPDRFILYIYLKTSKT